MKPRPSRSVRWAAALIALAAPALAGVAPEMFGLPLDSVVFDCPTPIDRDTIAAALPLHAGEPLTAEGLEASLDWLRAKDLFAAVEAHGRLTASGVALAIHLVPLDVVLSVTVSGAHHVSEADVLRRARVREDEPLPAGALDAAAARVRDLYVERGFPGARIDPSLIRIEPGRVRIRMSIDEGAPLRIAAVAIDGLEGDTLRDAMAVLPFAVGGILAKGSFAEGREALLRFLRNGGFYEAVVGGDAPATAGGAAVRYRVDAGPPYELAVSGNQAITTETLLAVTDLAGRPVITSGTWRLVAQRMQEYYRESGFAYATVGATVVGVDPKRVHFEVNEGRRVRVTRVDFAGNRAIASRELRALIQTQPRGRFAFSDRTGLFRDDVLQADLDALRETYRARGYLDAAVIEVRQNYDERREAVALTVEIREGDRSVVSSVRIEGAEELLTPPRGLALRPGVPFRPELLESDRRLVAGALAAQGYAAATVRAAGETAGVSGGERAVAVHFQVAPGDPVRVGRIVVQRNHSTLDRVILRELPFRSGDPFDPAKLVEAQASIYRLGIFRSVSVSALTEGGPTRDVAVRVTERPEGELQYGFGYNTRSGLRTFGQLADRNVFGTGRQASVRTDLNLSPQQLRIDEYVFTLDGKEPHLLDSNFDLRGSVAYQRSERAVDEFSIRRFDFATGLEREFSPRLRATWMVEFEDSDIFDVAPDAVLTGKDIGRLRTVTLDPTLVYDGRNDPFAPQRGTFETVRLRYGTPALGSEVHFFKLFVQHSQYVPLGHGLTWVYALRTGAAFPLGSSITIPLRERFFLGGRTTVRGFDENSIGPRGENGNPLGGDLSLNANTELRFPLFYGLGGAAFVDAGGLYLQDRVISLVGFRRAAGAGLRYQTPIGALSLDYGVKLDRRRGESVGEIHFTIGNLF